MMNYLTLFGLRLSVCVDLIYLIRHKSCKSDKSREPSAEDNLALACSLMDFVH